MTPPHILLFGDNTFEKLDTIKYLVRRAKASPTLARFLRDATDVAQIEMAKLSSIAARELTNFDSLLELAEEHGEQQEANEIVNITLACIARLGELIMSGPLSLLLFP